MRCIVLLNLKVIACREGPVICGFVFKARANTPDNLTGKILARKLKRGVY